MGNKLNMWQKIIKKDLGLDMLLYLIPKELIKQIMNLKEKQKN